MLITHFRGTSCNEDARVLLNDVQVGGIIYYEWANELKSKTQIADLSASLQERSSIPLFIAVDQEGGRVNRLKGEFTQAPSPTSIAESGDIKQAKTFALTSAKEMRSVGINFNLAPVADIHFSDRSYGNDPETVIKFAGSALEGYKEGGVFTCLKHFPGHGATTIDTHHALPIVNKTLEELEAWEFIPFFTLQADAIMTAHILLPHIDRENCATLSKTILTDILRKNFDGLIISDSLAMQGVLENCSSSDEAAIATILAGADMLILGGSQLTGEKTLFEFTVSDFVRIHRSIVNAIQNGRISEKQIDESISRIMQLKAKLRQKM
jgi:beta-N-acetylhexosaminidase